MIERTPDLTVSGQTGTVRESIPMLRDSDVAVVDLTLPDGSGIQLIREMRSVNPHGTPLVLTAEPGRLEAAEAVIAGAAGVLHKSVPIEEVIDAVRRASRQDALMSQPEVSELLRLATHHRIEQRDVDKRVTSLTPRELEVLDALAEGLTDKQIAQRLFVGHETVRTHMVNILGKLGVNTRLQALVFAVRHEIVDLSEDE
ncbi:MAG: LuxR C-terminal-related transcriptional regulator [Chloroflexota bacterium]